MHSAVHGMHGVGGAPPASCRYPPPAPPETQGRHARHSAAYLTAHPGKQASSDKYRPISHGQPPQLDDDWRDRLAVSSWGTGVAVAVTVATGTMAG